MESKMFEKAYDTVKKYNMLQKNDVVVIGISGGADSVSLFHFLYEIRKEYSLKLVGVHIHHGIRGQEADRDAEYVRELCNKYNVDFELFKYDIHSEAKKMKLTDEEAGRKIRYEVFNSVLEKYGSGKIAVAHNMNDQAETLLMRICRGTGLKGLTGILPVRDNIIRPLIECSRESIEEYCEINHLQYQKDYTNEMDIYTRNKIRLKLIPMIKENLNPSIISVLSRMREMLQDEEDYIEIQAKQAYEECLNLKNKDMVSINIEKINKYHKVIQKRIIRFALQELRADLHDIEFAHIKDILDLMTKSTGKTINLTDGIMVRKQYENLEFYLKKEEGIFKGFSYDLKTTDEEIEISEAGLVIKTFLNEKNFNKENFNNVYTKFFDCDKIIGNLKIRTRISGDKIYLKGIGTKKLKDFFIDIKLPREQRNQVPIVAVGNEVIWIVGYKVNEKFTADKNTKKILCIQIIPKK